MDDRNFASGRLFAIRVANGKTQQNVADSIGVKRETINQWESGTREIKARHITKLANYFNISADWLLGIREQEEISVEEKIKEREAYEQAISRYGKTAQMMVAIEEMSELTKELCKNFRGNDNGSAIAEEIADVEIMLEQLKIIFQCEKHVDRWKVSKLLRLEERLNAD